MRRVVQHGLEQFQEEVWSRGGLDELTAAEGLRHITGVMFHDLETRLSADSSVTLKRPQILHALHFALRVVCVKALSMVESDRQKRAMSDLLAQKAMVREHFLLIVQANKGDVERATNFAVLYHNSLMAWVDHEVTQLAAEVRNQVLLEMPDPQKSSELAFQQAFAAHNWPDVLEYVLDMSAYLEKLYLTVFHKRKRAFVRSAQCRVEKRVLGVYDLLRETVGQWARREDGLLNDEVDVAKGMTASYSRRRSVRTLKDFISAHAERVPEATDQAQAHRQLAERTPATADFDIADPKLFADTVQARLSDFLDSREIQKRVKEQLEKALREQSRQAWALIRGCTERCPLCGAKCDLVGEHSRHHCGHHLFPAFHGWMDSNTGLPSFGHCMCSKTHEGSYQCKDGVWRSFQEYFKSDHPAWLPALAEEQSNGMMERDLCCLQAAWVNCREPLLEYFAPMVDWCPDDWHHKYFEEGRALTKADLQTAKERIRRLRSHTWVPPDE